MTLELLFFAYVDVVKMTIACNIYESVDRASQDNFKDLPRKYDSILAPVRKTVAVIPAYNEEKTIAKVVLATGKFVDRVIVVDDGSTDLTGEIAEKMGAVTLRHRSNEGKGAALRTGIENAKKEVFDILVTLDADSQHDPSDIPKVIEPLLQKTADIVIGVRSMDSSIMPRDRIAGNKIFDAISNTNGSKIKDTQSGFRAYTYDALNKINFVENGMAVESQTFLDALNAGLKIIGVPVFTTYEGITPKRSPVRHFSQVLDYMITRTVANSPLLYIGLPGIVAVVIGIIAGLRVVAIFLNTHQIAAGTALIAVMLVIIGSVLVATSMVIKLLKIQSSH
ncbi:MAG: glycosyltransferase family 2 protein [Nitrososphaerota archaeon]|nr:glycosyltransferase family 2 protein [Nitrososphaerota archaeon]